MSQIDSQTIYLLIVFILPGFLAYSVCKSLYRQATPDSEIEVTYKSLLNSAVIYATVYLIFAAMGYSLDEYALKHSVGTVLIMVLTSIVWGILLFKYLETDFLFTLLSKIKFLSGRVQPPNLYAALLDPKFQPRAELGYWIKFTKEDITYEGYVKYTDVAGSERLAYVTEVKELDDQGRVLLEHPLTYGMLVDLTKLEAFEIIYGD